LVFPYVTETLRTESFFANMPSLGCFSLTDVVATMNSGIRVRESIRFLCQGRRCARTFSRRTVNGPRPWDAEEESRKRTGTCRVGACASRFANETNQPTLRFSTPNTASSKAHDNDGMSDKEFTSEH
jgi:hypothetical protein